MAWKPKTIFGKILKGAVTAGGSVLALASAIPVVGTVAKVAVKAVDVVKNVIGGKGTTGMSTAGSTVLSGIAPVIDKVKESVGNLLSGLTAEQRAIVNAQKEQTKTEEQKLLLMEKLINAGATPEAARAAAGLPAETVPTYDGKPVQAAGLGSLLQNKTVLIGLAALAGLALISRKK